MTTEELYQPWTTSDQFLDLKERELFFLTAETCGFKVYEDTRRHEEYLKYCFICFSEGDRHLTGHVGHLRWGVYYKEFPRKEILEAMRTVIKEQLNQQEYEKDDGFPDAVQDTKPTRQDFGYDHGGWPCDSAMDNQRE